MTPTISTKQFPAAVVNLPSAIDELANLPAGQHVLSVFVDTSPQRVERRAYLLALRDGFKTVRADLPQSESELFEAAAARVEGYLSDTFVPNGPGVALFATAPREALAVVRLPRRPVLEHVGWSEQAEISPLQAIVDDTERVAVVLFDAEHARLFTVFLGAIESQQVFIDYVPARQATGGWFGLQQTNFARHREEHLRRHVQHTIRALMDLLRTASFDHLLIAGPDEPVSLLRNQLPRPLRSRLAGELDLALSATDAEVLGASLKAAEEIERKEEFRLTEELLDSASSSHAVLGLAGTLDALVDGRVHQLILADSFAAAGAQCPACGRLVIDDHRCPDCGIATRSLLSLRETVVKQALAQDAIVEFVAGAAATLLNEHGGIGAWTRF
jgi:Bacterial archaeo-eukaryotic release factor family 10